MNWQLLANENKSNVRRRNQIKSFHGQLKDNYDNNITILYGKINTEITLPKMKTCINCNCDITIDRAGSRYFKYCRNCGAVYE